MSISLTEYIGGAVVVFLLIVAALILYRRPRKLKVNYYQEKWIELQKLCRSKKTWADAIINADHLLDEALKKRHYNGKSMGERLVAAQRIFTDNDSVWYGHKLKNKLEIEPAIKLREKEVKEALVGIRQALKDMGALPDGRSKDPE
jgi:hypothetical protein